MGTKNKPGDFDCLSHLEDDEPYFLLLGRDRNAGLIVRQWADVRESMGEDPAKVAEARACALAMDAWATKIGKKLVTEPPGLLLKLQRRIRKAIELLPHAPASALDVLREDT